ncbi:TolC family outer membrane protein [Maritimibacter sp. DP1N21-5]|nr:TolC family outer membrane protein [Maritimibacter sp. DP1N21-5]
MARAALALSVALTPVAVSAETLADALVAAYKNSGLLEQQRALLRAEDENVAIAVSALRPVISYSATAGRTITDPAVGTGGVALTDTWNASVTLSAQLLLFDFGQTDKQIEIARENVLMTREALVGVEQNVLLNAAIAYLDVVSANEAVGLQNNSVRLITQELRAARDRFEVGEITQTDVSLAEAALAAGRANAAAAQGQLLVARESYKAAVGFYPGNLAPLPPLPRIPESVEAAKAQARVRHPDILSAQRAVTVAEKSVELAKLSTRPTVTATSNVTRTARPGDTMTGTAGITLSGPIYAGGRLTALYRQAIAQSEASRAALLITTQAIERAVGNAWAQLTVAGASLQATDQQIRASQVALRGAREEATLGARTTLDVLNAEQDLLDAQTSAVQSRADRYAAVYSLLSSMGLLTAEHLHLGIVTYDPRAYYNAVQGAPLRQVSPQGQKLDHILEALGKN